MIDLIGTAEGKAGITLATFVDLTKVEKANGSEPVRVGEEQKRFYCGYFRLQAWLLRALLCREWQIVLCFTLAGGIVGGDSG